MSEASTIDVKRLIEERLPAAERDDLFGVLDLDPTAPSTDIQAAYFAVAKVLHPDRFDTAKYGEIRKKAQQVFETATRAYHTLSDVKKRREYTAARQDPTKAAEADVERVRGEVAKIASHKGNVLLQKRAYREAEQFFRQAAEAEPKVPKTWRKLGWAVYQGTWRPDDKRLEEARKCWKTAIELNHSDADSHYFMSLYWQEKDRPEKVRDCLEAALQCKPTHHEARRGLRLLEMRQGKTRPSSRPATRSSGSGDGSQTAGGVLSKLFGGKRKKR